MKEQRLSELNLLISEFLVDVPMVYWIAKLSWRYSDTLLTLFSTHLASTCVLCSLLHIVLTHMPHFTHLYSDNQLHLCEESRAQLSSAWL